MGKKCDLCSGVARMYCESDQASLCWECDGKVHGANFLVAKHTRCLLCCSCQSLTPWKASGLRLGPSFSVCDSCVALKRSTAAGNRIFSENRGQEVNSFDSDVEQIREDEGDGAESYDDDDEEEDEDEEYSDDEDQDEDVDDDEEAENQVVPWSEAAKPPTVMSSSSSDGGSGGLVTKRTRENSDLLCSDDEIGSSSAQETNYSRPSKRPIREEPAFKSTAEVNSIVRSAEERTLSRADTSSSSSLIFAIGKTRRDLSR